MKRRYKIGDWFRVPLPGEHDAVGIITHASRSRLFGYFFAVAAAHEPSFDELKRFRPRDALASVLFGGAGLEQARWSLIATSLAFDPSAWPFPTFASRGVFGRTWQRITYDPQALSIVKREAIDASQALHLPNARFATPEELESLLQLRIDGQAPDTPLVVCEVRSPVDIAGIEPLLSSGGRVQFSEPLDEGDLQHLASFINVRPNIELRVHGFSRFDVGALTVFEQLRSLVLGAGTLDRFDALRSLKHIESLRIGNLQHFVAWDALQDLPKLHRLEVRGSNADMRAVAHLRHLDTLSVTDTPPLAFPEFGSAPHLRNLLIAHASGNIAGFTELRRLERLQLRDLQLTELPDLSKCSRLHALELRNVTMLRDLTPVVSAPALQYLRIEGMPQLGVSDFKPLLECPQLRHVNVEIGSKTKSREIYRMLRGRLPKA